jgi:hypothetical protein
MTLEDIEEAILKLSPGDLAAFRRWFAEFQSGMGAPKAPEAAAAKIGRVAGRAVADFRKRLRDP